MDIYLNITFYLTLNGLILINVNGTVDSRIQIKLLNLIMLKYYSVTELITNMRLLLQ